ncbi:uncharacterized protein IL334_002867 [Kwoniella shivajii]|uniref:Uncharacterized protein n=1 Tax=Kwoniella shivajii TaxID=564305 RepID=A0ABZ1CYY7_9TREE|nr:hypothetical protein IL334_002867 [Kwoniella shivajii]
MSAPLPTNPKSHSEDDPHTEATLESNSDSQSIIESASSPTATIRQPSITNVPNVSQTFADILKSPPPPPAQSTSSSTPNQQQQRQTISGGMDMSQSHELKRSNSSQQQQELGKGRPGNSIGNSTGHNQDTNITAIQKEAFLNALSQGVTGGDARIA